MYTTNKSEKRDRRAAVLVLAAILLVMMFAFLAFAIDLGYLTVTRTQLQNAADAAALAAAAYIPNDVVKAAAEAKKFAVMEKAGGKLLTNQSVDVEFGTWDVVSRSFNSLAPGNAVRVTVRRDAAHDGQIPLFFAPVIGKKGVDCSASAIAMTNPRDICFVVDLSGSMNDDTEPGWTTHEINDKFGGGIGDALMQDVYTDFGFGAFPGTWQYVGQPLGASVDTYNELVTKLTNNMLFTTTYRIISSDNTAAKKKVKAYKYLIDYQLKIIMPNALPYPNAGNAASVLFWTRYLDYVISPQPTGATVSPLTGYGNPQTNSYPGATTTEILSYRNKLGYRTFVQFMMDYGRDTRPTGAGQDTQLPYRSTVSPYGLNPLRRTHSETIGGVSFDFPPREMPTHAARRSIITALQVVKERNANVSDSNERDWVSIVTFDKNQDASSITPAHDLNYDYDQAMRDCTTLQATSDVNASTSTSTGLLAAKNLLTSKGRLYTDKVVVLLTDGLPNLKDINSGSPPSPLPPGWPTDANEKAAMTQVYNMQSKKWRTFPVGIGLGCNYTFMDCAAVTGGTVGPSGHITQGSGDPSQYEETLKKIFKDIINNPRARLVK